MRVKWQQAIEEAVRCGFSYATLTPARRLTGYTPNEEALRSRIGDDPAIWLEGAQSVLTAVMPFGWFHPWPEHSAEVSAYYFASQQAHHSLARLSTALRERGAQVADGSRLPMKLLGKAAGVGVIGRNALLRNARWGSCFALRVLVTDIAPPEEDTWLFMPSMSCGECMRCVQACPTGALMGDGRLDTTRCLRAHMLRGTVIPTALRTHMGGRLLGCEICQRVCPANASVPQRDPPSEGFAIDRLLMGDRAQRMDIAQSLGQNEARLLRLQAQAAIAAGNTKDARYLPALQSLACHTQSAIAAHAAWAVERISKKKER